MKTPPVRQQIEENRKTISKLLSGSNTVKRMNNMNWLRHEIAEVEPRTLFYVPTSEQAPYLDYNCMKNIGLAYDYIINNPTKKLDVPEICYLHNLLCHDTFIPGGQLRTSTKVLEINVDGHRMHAPDASDVPYQLNEIIYKLNSSHESVISRAFNIHYELIALQPFEDFNKRTARLAMTWTLIKNGYRPIVFNHRCDKADYRAAIAANANGNHKAYTQYMYSCMLRTQNEIITQLKKSRIL